MNTSGYIDVAGETELRVQEAFRAGVAACVAVTADRQLEDGPCYCLVSPKGQEPHSKHCVKVRAALESLTDSAASPAAQEQEVNSGEEK